MRHVVLILVCLLLHVPAALAAANYLGADSPEHAVRQLAVAIRNKDINAFSGIVDINALLDSPHVLGEPDQEAPSSPTIRLRKSNAIIEGIASGTYALACANATRPGCPWYPAGLEGALISKPDTRSAIVAIDSARDIRTWLILHDTDAGWRVTAATDRFQSAESYARASFLERLEEYQESVKDKMRKDAENKEARNLKAISAEEEASVILRGIPFSDYNYAIVEGNPDKHLAISCTATNTRHEPVRLMRMRVQILDDTDTAIHEYEFLHGTEILQPGESKMIEMKSPLTANTTLNEVAPRLLDGSCSASARATALVLSGDSDMHIDEFGGDLLEGP